MRNPLVSCSYCRRPYSSHTRLIRLQVAPIGPGYPLLQRLAPSLLSQLRAAGPSYTGRTAQVVARQEAVLMNAEPA